MSMLTGQAPSRTGQRLRATKGYTVQRDFTFEPKVFSELKNAQAIVLGLRRTQSASADVSAI